ncbi:hypothetical protein LTR37_003515 [Vermiconidia calcicola]|uniref:Uncharacterized protein n=1 Tax=Vermiconidia calcicola TaxID=1690605 RepID=A0ACC3NR20_9PEZI|nr:hypothetical protein LTR37_003515 [Vermiconidia calcicola]
MSAVTRVFDVYELTENNYFHLPIYDLVLATALCQQWFQLASRSKKIREHLEYAQLPSFVPYRPGDTSSTDMCNVNVETQWLFRTTVNCGNVITLKVESKSIELFIPGEHELPLAFLDVSRTEVRTTTRQCKESREVSIIRTSKDLLWKYIRTFNGLEFTRASAILRQQLNDDFESSLRRATTPKDGHMESPASSPLDLSIVLEVESDVRVMDDPIAYNKKESLSLSSSRLTRHTTS